MKTQRCVSKEVRRALGLASRRAAASRRVRPGGRERQSSRIDSAQVHPNGGCAGKVDIDDDVDPPCAHKFDVDDYDFHNVDPDDFEGACDHHHGFRPDAARASGRRSR